MTWGAIGGAAVGLVGNSLLGDSGGGGGGGAQTVSKDPWSAADPWLRENLRTGQNLQNWYQQNPFSQQQQKSYRDQFANSDYMRSLAGSVMGQMNQQRPFDRSNPNARPQPYQLPPMGQTAQPATDPFAAQSNPFTSAVMQPAPVAPVTAAPEPGADNPGFQSWKQYITGQGYGGDVANYDYWRAFVHPDNQPDGPGVGGY